MRIHRIGRAIHALYGLSVPVPSMSEGAFWLMLHEVSLRRALAVNQAEGKS